MALVAAVGDDPRLFKNGRALAAWLGLVPRQHSTGGRDRLLGISKRGDVYLRQLLVHGARAVLRWVERKDDQASRWATALKARAWLATCSAPPQPTRHRHPRRLLLRP